ncbi:MAG TPA: aldo/keto reductase [Candidatus Binataceae bacterium]|nr:aldo/keto reductase [Candidatus Binataceae bacterium]
MTLSRAEFLRLVARALGAVALGGLAGASESIAMEQANGPNGLNAVMISRPIPKTGEMLPVIGLGTWQTFDVGQVNNDDAAALDNLSTVLRLLFDGGGKVIDSSPMYGRAEAVVGELLAKMHARDRAFLATKVWTSGREAGIAEMRRSAELLQTRVIDLMQIHNLVDWRTQLATLRKMKEAGQVRYVGITHYTPSAFGDLASIIEREEIDFVQLPYSIDLRDAEKRMLPLAAERRVAVMVNRPFGGGGLFRQVRGKTLPPWAAEFGCSSWAQFFLKYIVSHPAVTCVIPASAEPAHLSDDVKAGYGRIPDAAERRRMAEFWDSM